MTLVLSTFRNLRCPSVRIKNICINQNNNTVHFYNNLKISYYRPFMLCSVSRKSYNLFVLCNSHLNVTNKIDVTKRYFSKRKSFKKDKSVEVEESDNEEEDSSEIDHLELSELSNLVTRTVPSLRIDGILKSALNVTKKKIEREFYSCKVRLNGNRVLKKSITVSVGDEVDLVKGYSPDTSKFLLVDRIVVAKISQVTGSGNFPVLMEVLKSLTIENYKDDPWSPSSTSEVVDD